MKKRCTKHFYIMIKDFIIIVSLISFISLQKMLLYRVCSALSPLCSVSFLRSAGHVDLYNTVCVF